MKRFLTLLNLLFIAGCTSNLNINSDLAKVNKVKVLDLKTANTNITKGANISLKINHNNFNTKASLDGVFAGTVAQIKSYNVHLCTDPEAPTNTMLVGSNFSFNKADTIMESGQSSQVTFVNVPVGGPYYAVVSAYNDFADSSLRVNLNKPMPYRLEESKNVAVSSNSITVNSDLTLTPASTPFAVTINLRDARGASIETNIIPIDGNNGIFGN